MVPEQDPISDSDLERVERDAKRGIGVAGPIVLAVIARLRAAEAWAQLLEDSPEVMEATFEERRELRNQSGRGSPPATGGS